MTRFWEYKFMNTENIHYKSSYKPFCGYIF